MKKKPKMPKLEEIEEGLKEFENCLPTITHHVWEEDGQRYSAWKMNVPGSISLTTGDGGMALIEEAFRKRGFSTPAEFPKVKNHHRKQKKSKYIP